MIYTVQDRETIASVATAIGFTAAQVPPAAAKTIYAVVQACSGDVRFTIDGTTPTSTLGVRLPQDTIMEVWGSDSMANFLAIDDGGTATLEVIYMGSG